MHQNQNTLISLKKSCITVTVRQNSNIVHHYLAFMSCGTRRGIQAIVHTHRSDVE